MGKDEIAKKVEAFINENFIFDEGSMPGCDQSLLETGVIDSTGVLNLVMFLEETFGISVNDEELIPDNLDSINKIANFMSNKLG